MPVMIIKNEDCLVLRDALNLAIRMAMIDFITVTRCDKPEDYIEGFKENVDKLYNLQSKVCEQITSQYIED